MWSFSEGGLNKRADVCILAQADDSWLTYTVPVHELLAAGSNTLEVSFASVYDACEFSDPLHANVTCPGRVFVRQAAAWA